MKIILILSALLFSTSILASPKKKQYKLEMELFMDGEKVSQPTLHVLEGVAGTVETTSHEETRYINVVTTEGQVDGRKGILMKFDIGLRKSNGGSHIEFRPTLLSKNGKEAEIVIENENGKGKMRMKVTAYRVNG